jgi:pimeloyl-[acyl-carrier protein] methyl ester esterase
MTLHCERSGSGADVVLLHGWGMHGGVWSELAHELARRFRVHVVDLPGYRASPGCDPYTLERIAAEVARQMPSPCAVCGWSFGGQVALAWAGAFPQQVARLALIATTPCFTRRDDWPQAVEASVLEEFTQALTTDRAGALKRFLSLQALGDERAKQVARQLRQNLSTLGNGGLHALKQGLELLLGVDLREGLPGIRQPVLVLHGERDTLAPPAAGEYLARVLPHARLVRLRGAAHAPFLSDPRRVERLLAGFLDER